MSGPTGGLYVGSTGKDWTEGDVIVNSDMKWVKHIPERQDQDEETKVDSLDYSTVFEAIRAKTGYSHPGYIIHEAIPFPLPLTLTLT